MKKSVKKLVYAGMCLALCMVLPLITLNNQQLGNAFCLIHIPVLLCAFLCGPWYALMVGIVAPYLHFVIFGMPPLFPTGVSMCFELAVYGAVCGLLYKNLPKKTGSIYMSLIAAMLAGRLVYGAVRALLTMVSNTTYTWVMFFTGEFANAVIGIALHIALIPLIVLALKKAKIMD